MTFTREEFAAEDDPVGTHMTSFSSALLTWCAMQDRVMRVLEAAQAFNTTNEVVMEAVEMCPWTSLDKHLTPNDPAGWLIELDGE